MHLLRDDVDRIVFCDLRPMRRPTSNKGAPLPAAEYWQMDARVAVEQFDRIDILFYRRDGTSEGGSGLFVLGRDFFPKVLAKMIAPECRIVTDGSNSRGSRFQKMQRRGGLTEAGKIITLAEQQRFTQHRLLEFVVRYS